MAARGWKVFDVKDGVLRVDRTTTCDGFCRVTAHTVIVADGTSDKVIKEIVAPLWSGGATVYFGELLAEKLHRRWANFSTCVRESMGVRICF
jgi:hypothetical protein